MEKQISAAHDLLTGFLGPGLAVVVIFFLVILAIAWAVLPLVILGLDSKVRTLVQLQAANNDITAKLFKSMKEDLDQTWVEEFIYKFGKSVTQVSNNPGNPIDDCCVLASFFDTIEGNALDSSRIRGIDNKERFERTLLKARGLFDQLKKTPEVLNHSHQQEQARFEQEQLQAKRVAEKAAKRIKKAAPSIEALVKEGNLRLVGIAAWTNMDEKEVEQECLSLFQNGKISQSQCARVIGRNIEEKII